MRVAFFMAVLGLAVTAGAENLDLVLSGKSDNDLCAALGAAAACFDTSEQAIERANGGGAVLVLADAYPAKRVAVSDSALTLQDLRRYAPLHQFITLSCISNPVGGDLIGTTRWTGVSLWRLLPASSADVGWGAWSVDRGHTPSETGENVAMGDDRAIARDGAPRRSSPRDGGQ
jgi:hypothetical protein